jgi:hypothetical protein
LLIIENQEDLVPKIKVVVSKEREDKALPLDKMSAGEEIVLPHHNLSVKDQI